MGERRDGTGDQEHPADTTRPMAPPRADALAFSRAATGPRAEKARLAHDLYLTFCDRLHVPDDASDSCVLYLTWLWDSEHLSGAQLDRRLSLIDHVQALEGRATFRERPEIRTYLRGLLRTANLECVTEQATPVYREILAALVEPPCRRHPYRCGPGLRSSFCTTHAGQPSPSRAYGGATSISAGRRR